MINGSNVAIINGIAKVVVREAEISAAENFLFLTETDQIDPAGRWRWRLDGDKLYLERSTSAGWATDEDWITYDKANERVIWGKDIEIGANKLSTTNVDLVDLGAYLLGVRRKGTTTSADVRLWNVLLDGNVSFQASPRSIDAQNADDAYVSFRARDTGVGLVEIARMVGATDPYFQLGPSVGALRVYNSGQIKALSDIALEGNKLLGSDLQLYQLSTGVWSIWAMTPTTAGGRQILELLPSSGEDDARLRLYNRDPAARANAGYLEIQIDGTLALINAAYWGTGSPPTHLDIAGMDVDLNDKDLLIGAGKFKTTNLLIKELDVNSLVVRNAADTALKGLQAETFAATYGILGLANTWLVRAQPATGGYGIFGAFETALGSWAEVARLAGADDPYFSFGGAQEFKFYRSGYFEMAGDYDFIPATSGQGDIGTATNKFANVYALVGNFGDIRFDNNWLFTEHPDYGIVLQSPSGKQYRLVLEEI